MNIVSANLKLASKAANLAYYTSDYKLDVQCQSVLGEGWFALSSSKLLPNCNEYGFRGVAFINLEQQKVIISCAGTRIGKEHDFKSSFLDAAADLKIASGLIPKQFHDDAIVFADYIYEFTQSMEKNFEYITTGHSLGGVNAQLLGVYLASKTPNITSITFDHPGIKSQLLAFEAQYGLEVELSTITDKFCVVNSNSPNFINSYGKQFGIVHTADFCNEPSDTIFRDIQMQIEEHSLRNFTAPIAFNRITPEPEWNDKYAYDNTLITKISCAIRSSLDDLWDSFCSLDG
jgi:Lipase (class 3)